MVELHNGCVCCTLRGDLLKSVKRLSEEGTYDYLVIETTGISEPLPIAQTFTMSEEDIEAEHDHDHDHVSVDVDGIPYSDDDDDDDGEGGKKKEEPPPDLLMKYARLDTMVTVVDAVNMFGVLKSIETLADKNNSTGMTGNEAAEGEPEDDRSIVQLWLDQVEFANVLLVSKAAKLVDLHGESEGSRHACRRGSTRSVEPQGARRDAPSDMYGDLDVLDTMVNTRAFKMEEEQNTDAWSRNSTRSTPPRRKSTQSRAWS